ncbi:hypothetical protein, partial [Leyella stercorea]|uniref:hypothetical protein n=1 Tax=Leyella stercorea TaxID=363265 RepID=UPI00242AAB9B
EICGRISYARNFCEFCEICGRISYARNVREFCEFCGRTSEGGVGMAGCHTLLRKRPQIAQMCTD